MKIFAIGFNILTKEIKLVLSELDLPKDFEYVANIVHDNAEQSSQKLFIKAKEIVRDMYPEHVIDHDTKISAIEPETITPSSLTETTVATDAVTVEEGIDNDAKTPNTTENESVIKSVDGTDDATVANGSNDQETASEVETGNTEGTGSELGSTGLQGTGTEDPNSDGSGDVPEAGSTIGEVAPVVIPEVTQEAAPINAAPVPAAESQLTNGTVIAVDGLNVVDATIAVSVGATSTIISNVIPNNASDNIVVYESSDTNIVTVNDTGVVTGVSVGSAVVRAAAHGDISKFADVSITVVIPSGATGAIQAAPAAQ